MTRDPMMIPRKPVPESTPEARRKKQHPRSELAGILAAVSVLLVSVTVVPWARHWLLSGAAIESLLLLYTRGEADRILPSIPLWTILSTLNLTYAVSSTSWLLKGFFIAICYPTIYLTCLSSFPAVGSFSRKSLRKILGSQTHFIRDQVALFNLPALEIDTDVDGLFVVRGLTISFSALTIVAHGVEVGIKLADDIELAICVDEVTVSLFRRIDIGDVYANVKGGKFEMTLGHLEDDIIDDSASAETVFFGDTPLLRAATAGSEGFKNRPQLKQSITGGVSMKDSSAQAGYNGITKLSPDEEVADKQYRKLLREVQTTSAIYQSRQEALKKAKGENGFTLDDEKDMRAAICAELHSLPSIAHPPTRSVRVTTLQTMSPPWMRRFMHRLPLLLRLLLGPLSYFHPISIASINTAGSGQWVSALLEQELFQRYTETSSEVRRLHRRVSTWLADAMFCLQLVDLSALAQVPVSTWFDIVAQLKIADVLAYRTAQGSGSAISQVVRLGGADATFTIPSYLLPHHEHIIPPVPSEDDEEEHEAAVEEADGTPQVVKAEESLAKVRKDETVIALSVHASLPATFDQSLLNFVAALVKASKIIELAKEVVEVEQENESTPVSPTPDDASFVSTPPSRVNSGTKAISSFKSMTQNIKQNLKDGTYNNTIKDFAKDLHQSTREGMKKAVVGGLVHDRWIAKIVGKTAAVLQKAQGDVGYKGEIPIPLAPYRGSGNLPSKLLP